MPKVKLTKGELKKQRDSLRQYERYLPTLQLKKQQLQLEILQQSNLAAEIRHAFEKKKEAALSWAGLLAEPGVSLREWIAPSNIVAGERNVAGVDLPVFERVDFCQADYDLFVAPMWVDFAVEALRNIVTLKEEIGVIEKGINILKIELRVTTQRVNLFEKLKIPEAQEAIRLIKIYIGDQMANAVGRSKIAKRKIEQAEHLEVYA